MSDAPESKAWSQLDQYPPIKVRLWAHTAERPHAWISDTELSIITGIPHVRIRQIGRMFSWGSVTISEMRRFCAACRFDPTIPAHRYRVEDYEYQCLKRNSEPMQWLKRSPRYEAEALPLIRLLSEATPSPVQHVA